MAETNCVRQLRENMMMSKAELARKASVTVQTIDRIEKGKECRVDTKRKIILALGYKLADRSRIFMNEENNENVIATLNSVQHD
ncbi:MAG: transcriptional regulator [Nitrospinae bacterium CG11_big_fil_rev_8_21_14_0_20_45_15]|nr:MAG: transcriptional regulator [Nitrospinae bacterium CG11_big_fil_rev_8_21_14_0_20_45_15]